MKQEKNGTIHIPVRCSTLWTLCAHVYIYFKDLLRPLSRK